MQEVNSKTYDESSELPVATGMINDDVSQYFSESENSSEQQIGPTSRWFHICDVDPIGSIHRSWSVSIVVVVVFLSVTIFEVTNLHKISNLGFELAVIWLMIIQLTVSILGTFIMKRFSTSFSIGFLLGLVVVMAQQNLVYGVIFLGLKSGRMDHIFANSVIVLFMVYTIFGFILYRFRDSIIVVSPTEVIRKTKSYPRRR